MTSDQFLALITNITQPAIFASLFIWLFVSTRTESKEREAWFRGTIKELTDNLKTIDSRIGSIEDRIGRPRP